RLRLRRHGTALQQGLHRRVRPCVPRARRRICHADDCHSPARLQLPAHPRAHVEHRHAQARAREQDPVLRLLQRSRPVFAVHVRAWPEHQGAQDEGYRLGVGCGASHSACVPRPVRALQVCQAQAAEAAVGRNRRAGATATHVDRNHNACERWRQSQACQVL
ncbi:hypothetical protein GGI23_006626, partial [Coemansia sp. RSA 2559]